MQATVVADDEINKIYFYLISIINQAIESELYKISLITYTQKYIQMIN